VRQITGMQLLKEVSRSFYLSLRLLPGPMREAASLAYLLARASDTLADSTVADIDSRIAALEDFAAAVVGGHDGHFLSELLSESVEDPAERQLLAGVAGLLDQLARLPEAEASLIRNVIETIVSGQRLDLEVFRDGTASHPVVMGTQQDVDDYTFRVAGCVGEFWTRLAHLTLGGEDDAAGLSHRVDLAVAYGMGLQWVNILRDVPSDLAQGRCYLPVTNPLDRTEMMEEHRRLCRRARSLVGQGLRYCDSLPGRRLRMASVLPALLALETLTLLERADWQQLQRRVKIGRMQVYGQMWQALIY